MSSSVRIRLVHTELGWIATDEDAGVSSQPMSTREDALEDLDEALALASGELELSDETFEAIERGERDHERGRTVSHAGLKRELGLD